ncbi:PD-(D/E)XK nuclease family protein [Aquimarina sp. W85]|uniref:PD-(D/E)XK nuclease family protein n=1 Tax=Aquimarina rhodophyticola TaxID=3342246 RepID=UPI00366FC9B6
MKTFLQEVVQAIDLEKNNVADLIFVVPSKRAGLFLKKEIRSFYEDRTFFAPQIYSIEEFIEKVSGLKSIDTIATLFQFYETYLKTYPEQEKESFDNFSTWAQTLIHDFNEIDRYCIDHTDFFSYLSSIQDINHWYLQEEKTTLIQNYILFWQSLYGYYQNFRSELIHKKRGYQGLLYREAASCIQDYANQELRMHVFLGFNALNNAEQQIFQYLLSVNKAKIFWDADSFFMRNNYHEASLFLRNYRDSWEYYKKQPFQWIAEHFDHEKNIDIIGVPKNIGQAKYVGELITQLPKDALQNTAVVLADESLLLPILNSLPSDLPALNITMGMPLKEAPIAAFFEHLFEFHKTYQDKGGYYKQIVNILSAPAAFWLLGAETTSIINRITQENLVYVTVDSLSDIVAFESKSRIQLLFKPWKTVDAALKQCSLLINTIREKLNPDDNALELEYSYHFHLIFNKLQSLHADFSHLTTISALHRLYRDLLSTETIDFKGEPLQGLQLMGMLESRCLDFETIILTSVNEGILPAGKSTNSFIPFDLKKAYNLPTYKEKDAIYTYHFYRLLQRAKHVYLLYNTENEGIGGGEKSRFLHQLILDTSAKHHVKENILISNVPKIINTPIQFNKTQDCIASIQKLASYGLSPSSLTTYVRNPIDFYYRYVLGIKETEEVEETVAANTLGTVIHNTLENFYKPLENHLLQENDIQKMILQVDQEVADQFKKEYGDLDIKGGKNLLIFEVAKRYLLKFLTSELELIRSGNELKIILIEQSLKAKIDIAELGTDIYVKGKVDRIDQLNGVTRIIDYKTGKVTKSDVTLMGWDGLTDEYANSKIIQILTYALMQQKVGEVQVPFEAGIISFKNLKEGFLKFGTKQSIRGKIENEINQETLNVFEEQLKNLITEIFSVEIPFIEKEV